MLIITTYLTMTTLCGGNFSTPIQFPARIQDEMSSKQPTTQELPDGRARSIRKV